MGSGFCKSEKTDEDVNNQQIDAFLQKEKARKKNVNEIKILFLGPGESGKSTMLKQMRILSTNSTYTEAERKNLVPIIYGQIFSTIKILLLGAASLNIQVEDKNMNNAERIKLDTEVTDPPPHRAYISREESEVIKSLWHDKGIQEAVSRRSEMSQKGHHIPDSTQYFMEELDRVILPDFLPNNEDILRCRVKTVAVIEHEFHYKEAVFRMVDVGGQRNERRKWLYMFTDVTAIIFCVALSEYDLCLREDIHRNRMQDALETFDKICNYKLLKDTCLILFLNKEDEFKEKIAHIDLNVCFPEYKGGCNYKAAIEHIENKFKEISAKNNTSNGGSRNLYINLTTATSTVLMDNVMRGVKDIILSKVMRTLAPAAYI